MLSPPLTNVPIQVDTFATPQSSQRAYALLAFHVEHDARGLAELLDACHGAAAGDRARHFARLAKGRAPDLDALSATVALLMRDLGDLGSPPELCAPHALKTQAAQTLDAAVLYHTGKIATLERALRPADLA